MFEAIQQRATRTHNGQSGRVDRAQGAAASRGKLEWLETGRVQEILRTTSSRITSALDCYAETQFCPDGVASRSRGRKSCLARQRCGVQPAKTPSSRVAQCEAAEPAPTHPRSSSNRCNGCQAPLSSTLVASRSRGRVAARIAASKVCIIRSRR